MNTNKNILFDFFKIFKWLLYPHLYLCRLWNYHSLFFNAFWTIRKNKAKRKKVFFVFLKFIFLGTLCAYLSWEILRNVTHVIYFTVSLDELVSGFRFQQLQLSTTMMNASFQARLPEKLAAAEAREADQREAKGTHWIIYSSSWWFTSCYDTWVVFIISEVLVMFKI